MTKQINRRVEFNISEWSKPVPTEAYSRPLSFIARYFPEKSPFIATTPTSTAVISMMPVTKIEKMFHTIKV